MNYYTKIYTFMLCFLAAGTCIHAQEELVVGDKLPDYTFNSVLRYSAPSVNLSHFRGKILILDLWRTTCSHAVASFTHFDSLQREFGDQLAAIAITTEKRNTIIHYLEDNGYAKETTMPVITDDTLLAGKRFKFIYIPHVVLADSTGTIIAITQAENITETVIRDLLAGKHVRLPLKKEITDFNYNTPVFAEGSGRNLNSLVYTSTITHRLPGVVPLQDMDTDSNRIFYEAYNVSIADLYAQAYHITHLKRNRLMLYVEDSSRFYQDGDQQDEDWLQQNTWCYNLILPKTYTHPEQYAVEELNRFFGVQGYMEQQQRRCLLLVRTGKGERWKSGDQSGNYYMDSAGVMLIHNVAASYISNTWDATSRLPIIDRTGLDTELVSMQLSGSPNELAAFRKQLQQYDLDLVPAVEALDVLVIKENKNK